MLVPEGLCRYKVDVLSDTYYYFVEYLQKNVYIKEGSLVKTSELIEGFTKEIAPRKLKNT